MDRKPILVGGIVILAVVGLIVFYQIALGVFAAFSIGVSNPGDKSYHFYCLSEDEPIDDARSLQSIPPADRAIVRKALDGETQFVNKSRADSLAEYGVIEQNNTTYQCYIGTT